MPLPADDSVSGVWRDRLIFLVGGWATDNNVDVVQIFDPAQDTWTRGDINPAEPTQIAWRAIAHHPGPARYRTAAGPVHAGGVTGVMFVGGTTNPYNYNGIGYDGQPSEPESTSWIYDIDRDAWIAGPSTPPTMDHRGFVDAAGAYWTVGGMGPGQAVEGRLTGHRSP